MTPALTTRSGLVMTATTVALISGFASVNTSAAGASRSGTSHERAASARVSDKGDFDARVGGSAATMMSVNVASAKVSSGSAVRALRASLGSEGIVDLDGTTGTPRMVARLDGYLTGASSASARSIALRYVRAHLSALGMRASDLRAFTLQRDYVDVDGTHHLSWTQSRGGVEVFGNGLQASVTKTGRLLTLGGSPISGLRAPSAAPSKVGSRSAAIAAARRDVGETAAAGRRDTATPVLFVTSTGTHLGWRVITMSAARPLTTVVDAHSGQILFRKDLSSDGASLTTGGDAPKSGGSTGEAWRYYPGSPLGGVQRPVNYTARGWLSPRARILFGNNSHTYSDLNDNNVPSANEEVPPTHGNRWNYKLTRFHVPGVAFCRAAHPCSWNPDVPFSWRTNRKTNAQQVFFFVNNFHDHLVKSPIGFNEAAGNFQVINYTGRGVGGDPVDTQTDDGANTDHGLPDANHVDNANMSTPPDGQSPTMQMYLGHLPGTAFPTEDPLPPINLGDEADVVYHEYTHGLSNRLVVDAMGNSTLGAVQAGSMGEAWSDWYAMDYLVDAGVQQDKPGQPDVSIGPYTGSFHLIRTEPMDCKVGSPAARCIGGATGHTGGYTYADFGKVVGTPEVHSDGEIWGQTLWDLRDKLGSAKTESLVTRAMELSPSNPSFVDERNAILLADTAVFTGHDRSAIWKVFAHRGMGYFAGSIGGDDATPGADFHTPPTTHLTGTVHGKVTNADTGAPVAGVTVELAFEGTPGLINPSARTGLNGRYRLGPVPVGRYPKLFVGGRGLDPQQGAVTVTHAGTTKNFVVRRDWTGSSGGAEIASFNGPDYSPFGCGPPEAIDQSLATGWGSTTGDDNGDPTGTFVPKRIVVDMHQRVDVSQFAVDPTATCGDDPSASTGAFRIETSSNGSTWTTAAQGSFTSADTGHLNSVTPTAGAHGVRFVRFSILGNQVPDFTTNCPAGAFSGCSFTDLTEMEVYGAPSL